MTGIPRILIVDDDEAIRRLVRLNLTDLYEIFDTGQPEEALALALEHKPDAILLDLRMPGYSGFELCKTFTSFSATQLIPVFVISGEGGAKTKDFCRDLGAAAYFEKPVDFDALRDSLAQVLHSRRLERRKEVRVGLRVPLKLSGKDANGKDFSLPSTAENVSKGGFLCACAVVLTIDSIIDVFIIGAEQEQVGKARVVRAEWAGKQYPRYGFAFTEMIGHWALQ
jgi:CheY-like chemotaxis protein